jgi:DNA-binding response OmpR family regulator
MHLESITESAETIGKEVPGLSDVAQDLAQVLKKGRLMLNKLFDQCNREGLNIDLSPEEQNEISLKVALVTNPDQVFQYARIVQLVFQLNYFSKCYEKALEYEKLPKIIEKEAKKLHVKIEEFRRLIEKEYVASI